MNYCQHCEGDLCHSGHCHDCEKSLCPECSEAAYERYLERYYGGDVATEREQQIKAYEEKRRLHR